MADRTLMDLDSVPEGIEWQARHAEQGGAPGTAKVIRALLALLDGETATGRRIAGWQGLVVKDAMPLRIAGGLHNLLLTGEDGRLADVYAGRMTDQASVDQLVRELVETYDTRLMPWLDGPPQTNEAGRSASIMAGLLWLSGKIGPQFELFEIGSSAGINTMMDRYGYELGGICCGLADSPMQIAPEWRGPPPPDNAVEIVDIKGCDLAPVDLSDPEQALRLKSYVWPEASIRMNRIDAAIALAIERRPDVVAMDAADFVEQRLAMPQSDGTCRALFHSIVWQYLSNDSQSRITAAMENFGTEATHDRPLAWLRLETNRETFRHELSVRYWPGGEEWTPLAEAHPHGAWIDWRGA